MAKKHISLYIDEKVIKESKQIGLNISRVCENVLREAVERLKGNADKHLFANINVECWARGLVARAYTPTKDTALTRRGSRVRFPAGPLLLIPILFFEVFFLMFIVLGDNILLAHMPTKVDRI